MILLFLQFRVKFFEFFNSSSNTIDNEFGSISISQGFEAFDNCFNFFDQSIRYCDCCIIPMSRHCSQLVSKGFATRILFDNVFVTGLQNAFNRQVVMY